MVKVVLSFCAVCALIFACSSAEDRMNARAAEAAKKSAEAPTVVVDGGAVYKQYCVLCHGADGKMGTNGAKDLTQSAFSLEERIEMIKNGKGLMTPFKEILSDDEIKAVAEYTFTLKAGK